MLNRDRAEGITFVRVSGLLLSLKCAIMEIGRAALAVALPNLKEGRAVYMNLQNQRLSAGLTQKKLSELSGVTLRVIQQYECGQRNVDGGGLEILCRLAIAIGCNLVDILESEDLKELVRKCT